MDALIVGAGPAGCAAAILLARAGREVLMVDKALPRDKLCGGLLSGRALRLLRERLGLELPASVVGEVCAGFEICDGRELLNSAEGEAPLTFVFRDRFDAFLLEAARGAGCRVEPGRFEGLRGDAAVVDGRELRCGRIVGADGVFSAVGRAQGKSLPDRSLAVGLQVDVPRSASPALAGLHAARIFFGYLRLGWGWAFPKGERVSIGLGGMPGTKEDLAAAMRRLLADCGVAGSQSLKLRGAKLPNAAFLREPAAGQVLLCGDAAGFAEPLTGEGIAFALHSGALAAQSMLAGAGRKEFRPAGTCGTSDTAGAGCAARYNAACRSEITPLFAQALRARNLLFREPFRSLAMRRFRAGTGAMKRFLRVLSGESDYRKFFSDSLLGR
ncbi:MAG: geranylgeranyl reductase family protein [Elusimicrobia bacterium]|jgi:geranylgeranyl reductase family protein|nr:geranylgeranyl reductase family protein [Elusimicrobiota bacterium]